MRELEHAVSRGGIFAANGWIRAEDLGLRAVAITSLREAPDDPDAEVVTHLTVRQEEIARLARVHGVIRRADLVARYEISGETARRELTALVRPGVLTRNGRHRGCRYSPVGAA